MKVLSKAIQNQKSTTGEWQTCLQTQTLTSRHVPPIQKQEKKKPMLPPSTEPFSIDDWKEAAEAEILWVLKMVVSHYSFRSTSDLAELFQRIFKNCPVAKIFSIGYDKASYLLCFGIAPYYESQLLEELNESRSYCISFDESMNKDLQQNQMDIHVRYWDRKKNMVVTRYLTSEFLRHCSASDLKDKLMEAIKKLSFPKVQQISMDGPNVNLKLLKELKSEMQDENSAQLLATGTCGMHIVHNAIKCFMVATGWNLNNFLKAAHNLFKDSPARRNDFTSVSGNSTFPLKFCGHRWLENVPVAMRLLAIITDLKKYIEKAQTDKVMRRRVKGNCHFDTMVVFLSGSKSDLTAAKLHFFCRCCETS